ncbi:hypothetical protein BGZ65_011142, partial [Modicella reniformis]
MSDAAKPQSRTTTPRQRLRQRAFFPTRHSETIYRHRDVPEGMNLNVRSASEKTLIFFLPHKDVNPFDIIKLLVRSFGHIDSFEHTFTGYGSQLEILILNQATYDQVKRDGIDFDGYHLRATVPTPARFDVKKVSFCRAPLHYQPTEFKHALRGHGTVLQIDRYYWLIEGSRVYSADGFVLFHRTVKVDSRVQDFPRVIDF